MTLYHAAFVQVLLIEASSAEEVERNWNDLSMNADVVDSYIESVDEAHDCNADDDE